jgi:hypothetical protein
MIDARETAMASVETMRCAAVGNLNMRVAGARRVPSRELQ